MASSASNDDRPNGAPIDPSTAAAPAAPQTHAEWAASMQAYYAAAAAAGHPCAWPPTQHLMAAAAAWAAYSGPVPFPVYHPVYYAHASKAAGVPHMAGETAASAAAVAEGKSKRKSTGSPSGEGASACGDGGSEESSEKRDAGADQKGSSSAKRRKSSNANAEGEPSQAATVQNAAAESPFMAKGRRSASKLSISAPGRAALPNATPNLNIGMDLWSDSPSTAVPPGQEDVNAGAPSQPNGTLSQMDERELKRERRKQCNRESARRSRLRKQQECEELAQKVTDLTAVNSALRSELDQLKKDCEDTEAENSQLMDEMVQSEGPSVLTTLSIQIDTSKVHHGSNGQLNKHRNNGSKG